MKKKINTITAFRFFHLARYSTLILTGVVLAKSAISQTAIGEYETFIFLAGAVSFFWLNGLLKSLLPLSAEEEKPGESIFSAFVLISFFSILAALFLLLMQPSVSIILLNGGEIPELPLLLVYLVFGIPSGLVEYFYLIRKKNRILINYAVISFSVQLAMVALPVVIEKSIMLALTGLVLSSILRYLWLWIIFIKNDEIHFSFIFMKSHLKLGIPLIVASLLSGSAQYVDGFIVTSRYDESVFAVFRYGARELPLATLLANALNNALLPEFGKRQNLRANLESLRMNILKLNHYLFPLTALLILISYPLFPVIFNPGFRESATIFNIYLLLVISRMMMPQTILTGLKFTKDIMIASFLELILNISLSLLLVKFLGIAGVAYATFFAFLFEKIYLAGVVKRKLKISFSEYHPLKYFLIYSTIVISAFIFAEFIFN